VERLRVTNAQTGHASFAYRVFLYRTPQQYLDSLVPFISDGVRAGQAVRVAVPGPNLAVLGDGLGRLAAHVVMADITEAGHNPGRILGVVLTRFGEKYRDQPVRMIGDPIWPSRFEVEYPACVQYEALINYAFAGRDVSVVCPYNVARLDRRVIADAQRAHFFTGAYTRCYGLSLKRIADLQLIASELATSGRHLDDPLAGHRPYSSDTARRRGLCVVNAAADLVRTHTTTEEATIHAYLRLRRAS
jgi:DcmR-like sensory protein